MIHPPKTELFDIAARTNTDPKGIVRAVDTYREEPFGLYMARPTPGRNTFHYLESWLLPELNLRVSDYYPVPGGPDLHDLYYDVVTIERGAVWRTTDLYLDLVQNDREPPEVLDTDELLDALLAGHLNRGQAEHALHAVYATLEGLSAHDYHLPSWLATRDITLRWRQDR